jgi:ubiquinone/menaquinone biosynthesis C-methylase UbiE
MPLCSFDALAPFYRFAEFMLAGEELQEIRGFWLETVPVPLEILMLGEGPGRMLEVMARRFPGSRITMLDQSPNMSACARRAWEQLPEPKAQADFFVADALLHVFEHKSLDLLITPFFLDCFTHGQLEELIPRLTSSLRPGGQWLISDFAVPDNGFARLRAQILHSVMYAFFHHFVGIPAKSWTDPAPILSHSGMTRTHHRMFNHGLLISSVWKKS